jgi:hypothetical protein
MIYPFSKLERAAAKQDMQDKQDETQNSLSCLILFIV